MSSITISQQSITATVSGGVVQATVPASSPATAAVTGGVGPVGPQGVQGAPGNALSAASDVVLAGVADGDVLRYANNKWRNYPDKELVIDGANF